MTDALMLFLAQVRDDLRRLAEEANRMLNAQAAAPQDTAPSDEAASGLSNFIRNASDERKAEVYGRVMDKAAEKQQAVVDGATSPNGYSWDECTRATAGVKEVAGDGDYYSEEAADIAESKARNAGVVVRQTAEEKNRG